MACNQNIHAMNIKRLLIIDNCLRDDQRTWSLGDLIEACQSTEKNSKRSVQADLETLRKVYNAPIVVKDKKFYSYGKEYKLTDAALSSFDKSNITNALNTIADYCDFRQMSGVEQRLYDLYEYIGLSLNIPIPSKSGEDKSLKPIMVRLWIDSNIAEKIKHHPIHYTQKIEQEEIDGSINIVMNIPITCDFENYLLLNSHQIRVTYPSTLATQIRKLETE